MKPKDGSQRNRCKNKKMEEASGTGEFKEEGKEKSGES